MTRLDRGRRLSARFDFCDRLCHQLVHGAADLVIGLLDVLGVEIPADLPEHVVVAGFLEIGHDHLLGISLGLRARKSELLRRPQPEQLVAARARLEFELLVASELLLETFLALVESGHACLAASGAAGVDARSSEPAVRTLPARRLA